VALPSTDTDGAFEVGRPSGRPTGSRIRGHQLTDLDKKILCWIARHGVVTTELVGRRFYWRAERNTYGKWATYSRLAALTDMRLIIRTRSYGYPLPVLRVTREGARIAEAGLWPAPLVNSELHHSIALVWLTEYLLREHAGAQLVTERELRAQRYRERREGDRQPEHGRTPDALLLLPSSQGRDGQPETVAIELDLSRKDRRAIENIIHQYDHEHVDRIWWFVRPGRVDRTRAVVRELRAQDRIEVRQWLA
jgi:hypothetical protein